jgi:hypothetical protein
MRRPLAALMILLAPVAARAEDGWTVSLSGEVNAGEDFSARLPGGLVFMMEAVRQAPPNPPGWTIRMHKDGQPEPDLVWPANPPYRFDNVRYLDTSYSKTPEQIVAWNPRRFSFYDDPQAAQAKVRWIEGAVLWPAADEPPLAPDPRGIGVLNILDSRIGVVGEERAVMWMRFEIRLTVEP